MHQNRTQWTPGLKWIAVISLTILDWRAIGELIGGLAVILSLIYVGTQVRQNTKATKLTSYQHALDKLTALDLLLAKDQALHRIAWLVEKSRDELTEEEWSRYTYLTLPNFACPLRMACYTDLGGPYLLRFQPVDATHALNLAAGVSKPKVFLGRSFS